MKYQHRIGSESFSFSYRSLSDSHIIRAIPPPLSVSLSIFLFLPPPGDIWWSTVARGPQFDDQPLCHGLPGISRRFYIILHQFPKIPLPESKDMADEVRSVADGGKKGGWGLRLVLLGRGVKLGSGTVCFYNWRRITLIHRHKLGDTSLTSSIACIQFQLRAVRSDIRRCSILFTSLIQTCNRVVPTRGDNAPVGHSPCAAAWSFCHPNPTHNVPNLWLPGQGEGIWQIGRCQNRWPIAYWQSRCQAWSVARQHCSVAVQTALCQCALGDTLAIRDLSVCFWWLGKYGEHSGRIALIPCGVRGWWVSNRSIKKSPPRLTEGVELATSRKWIHWNKALRNQDPLG